MQTWRENISNMPKLEYYLKFKTEFEMEQYLQKLHNKELRITFTKFRLSSHNLNIETGRYKGVERNNRICQCCNLEVVESEYHFLLICPKYAEIRKKYLNQTSWQTIEKFTRLMSTKSKRKYTCIAKYLKEAETARLNHINS